MKKFSKKVTLNNGSVVTIIDNDEQSITDYDIDTINSLVDNSYDVGKVIEFDEKWDYVKIDGKKYEIVDSCLFTYENK